VLFPKNRAQKVPFQVLVWQEKEIRVRFCGRGELEKVGPGVEVPSLTREQPFEVLIRDARAGGASGEW
jgi:hypothetical protein